MRWLPWCKLKSHRRSSELIERSLRCQEVVLFPSESVLVTRSSKTSTTLL